MKQLVSTNESVTKKNVAYEIILVKLNKLMHGESELNVSFYNIILIVRHMNTEY